MRLSPLALALALPIALGACRGAPSEPAAPALAAPEPPRLETPALTGRSHDRRVEVTQAGAAGACRLEVRAVGRVVWSAATCAAEPGDRIFASPDGERLLVLAPIPEHRGADWSEAVVLTLLERGSVVRRVAAAELLGPERAADMGRHYSWLRGLELGGDPGAGARYAADGSAVEVETVAGRSLTLGFDGRGLPPPPSAEAQARAERERREAQHAARDAADTRVYRWEDAEGAVHFTRAGRIPAAARTRAVPVEAEADAR